MVKVIPKEYDTSTSLPSEESSHHEAYSQVGDVPTISTMLQNIPRPLACKNNKALHDQITSRKWSPR